MNWEWYGNANVVRVFLHLLMLANHKPNQWEGINVERGQTIRSYGHLATALSLSVQQIRTALNKLKSTNEITVETTNRFTMITISNYSTYHDTEKESNKRNNKQITNEQQTNNKQITTNKNEKNEKNDKKKEKDLYLDFVKLTKDEHEKLVKKFGEKGTEDRIWNLNDYGHRKKKKFNEYTDHYRTILNWERRKDSGKDNRGRKQEPIKKAETKSSFIPGRNTVITIED